MLRMSQARSFLNFLLHLEIKFIYKRAQIVSPNMAKKSNHIANHVKNL